MFIERNKTVSWSYLKDEITKRFQDRRTDIDIRRQLESRRQRIGETFYEFYSDLLELSLQFEIPITDSELMYIIRRNMRVGLQDKVSGIHFHTIEELVRKCVAHEDTWSRTGYTPELLCQKRNIHELQTSGSGVQVAPQCNLEKFYDEISSLNIRDNNNWRTNQTVNIRPGNNCFKSYNCWNYFQSNHCFKDCLSPITRRFCFGCGANDVLKPNCENCKHSGNAQKGVKFSNHFAPKIKTQTEDSACNTDPELKQYQIARPLKK